MASQDLEHLDLLADVDALMTELRLWSRRRPDWAAARSCAAKVRRLSERVDTLRVRWQAPLVVATLGGTGTGKSALVNALVGEEVSLTGRQRPTTRLATLICHPDTSPQMLGIDPAAVHLVQRDLPALRDLVLLDCPDPDTSEGNDDGEVGGTNLARLRELLPHCDVLLVTSTQQKYRSACVREELTSASAGAQFVFVQTHADVDDDIRNDWSESLGDEYQTGEIFFVDSLQALTDARAGDAPQGEFARLTNLLTRSLAGSAAKRIRRANFLDLMRRTLDACAAELDENMVAVEQLESAITEQRGRLAAMLADTTREELLQSRRSWEERLLGEVANRWGFSPFSAVLRLYQGLGSLLGGAALARARSPIQVALWGAAAGGRAIQQRRRKSQAAAGVARAVATSWDAGELRTAAIILDGYAGEAGFSHDDTSSAAIQAQAVEASAAFVPQAAAQLQKVIATLAKQHTGWFTRVRYEFLLLAMIGIILYRLGKNFFYDSWLAAEPTATYGWDFFVHAAFWIIAWSALLLWMFTSRLRRGLRGQINTLTETWSRELPEINLFGPLEDRCRAVRRFRQDLDQLQQRVVTVRKKIEGHEPGIGHRVS